MIPKGVTLATYEFWGKVTRDITIDIDAKDKATAILELSKLSNDDILRQERKRTAKQDIVWDLSDIWTVANGNSTN